MSNSAKQRALLHRDPNYDYPVAARGEGIYLYDDAGNRYIDGVAGATNVTLGHGRKRIVDAMSEQGRTLAYCFSQHFTNQPALDLAERIATLAPGELDHVYFVSGGSEANESAFKMARQYHIQRGNGQKHLVISRWRAYHGATMGALSATGIPWLRAPFAPWLAPFPHIAACYPYRCEFAECESKCNLTCARELERTILEAGQENVAAFVAEPVVFAGVAAGMPPPDYYPLIREICDRYDVLFIADEVITGFGRTGRYFGMEHWDVVPDMITFGKGVSSGYCPLGGVIISRKIRECFEESGQLFPHIFTYVNNPVAMSAGLAVLDIIEDEALLEHVTQMGRYLLDRSERLNKHPTVGEIRGIGLLFGIELVRDKITREPFSSSLEVHKRLHQIMQKRGLSLFTASGAADWENGDDLRFAPPFIITREQIDGVIDILDQGLGELEEELGIAQE